MDAYSLKGKEWSIVFVGGYNGFQGILNLFFKDQDVFPKVLERVPIWKLPEQSNRWLGEGVNLVICELSRLCPWKPSATYSFISSYCVTLILDIPANPDDLLVGRRMRGPRRYIRQAEKNGFSYRYTRSLEDYEFYYFEMYLPFVKTRHGEQAQIAQMADQYTRWFKPGGLILITQHDQPVAGSLVIRTGKMCHGSEMGILHCAPELLEAGVPAFIMWSTILWSHKQKAEQLNLGTSNAWYADGSFDSKTKWGAHVVRRKYIASQWSYLYNNLPDSLREKINQIGLISEQKGKFYCTYIPGDLAEDLDKKVQEALLHGLSGLAVVHNGSTQCLTASLNPDLQE